MWWRERERGWKSDREREKERKKEREREWIRREIVLNHFLFVF